MYPRTLRGWIFVGILLLILAYALFVGRNYLRGLSLSVESPVDGATLDDPYLTVSGMAFRVSRLAVNGAKVSPEPDGRFSYALLLPPGYTIIEVEAEDRFGRKKLIRRSVYETGQIGSSTRATTN